MVGNEVTGLALRCRSCGAALDEGDRFCPCCGVRVAVDCCPLCGSPVHHGDTYCSSCGHYLQGDDRNGTARNPSSLGDGGNDTSMPGSVPDSCPDPAPAPDVPDVLCKRAGKLGYVQRHRLSLGIAALEVVLFIVLSPVHDVTSIAFSQILGFIVGTAVVYMAGVIPFAFSLKKWGICSHSHVGLWFLGTCDVLIVLARAGMLRAANGGPAVAVIVIGLLSFVLGVVHERKKRRNGGKRP